MAADVHRGLLTLGEGYFVPLQEIELILPAQAADDLKPDNTVDATFRRRARSAIWTRSGKVILSHLSPDTIAEQYAAAHPPVAESQPEG
jgi:regulator of extracellular matrix RemA (YlzA/DUF370 family)